MTTLLLVLSGPLQSWGADSRFATRGTQRHPTKSAVIGLVAAAQGRRRTDPIEDLARLRFGVRLDQPGRVMVDYHTATRRGAKNAMLSYRHYLEDAVFLAGLEGDAALLDGIRDALSSPRYLPFLGRRSCPPARPVFEGIVPTDLRSALAGHPWQASGHVRRRALGPSVRLQVVLDAAPELHSTERVADLPVSFDPADRRFGWREVERASVEIASGRTVHDHDPLAVLGGA